MRPQLMSESGIYVIEMGLGVFEDNDQYFQTEHLIFDTGSDLAWTQCEGCDPCFHQSYDHYPASRSKSYSEIPCSDCASVGRQCNVDRCEFARAHETFVFGNDQGQFVGLENIVLGCSYSMTDFSEGETEDNRISGILGMSYGALSLVKQATVETNG
ncbi:hypothetical protein Cgig2_032632 [Carnegiea gigantea]|uniref:Peptidase A1 domain-containing protein n=1 Tax=Carnegiea gigantea TaxID=171969 RepID=A0A9Q1KYU2_9CARY|nr:hypothetical protein Cgig2_032632 [Carnegiea gigantea]